MPQDKRVSISGQLANIGNELGYSLRKALYHHLYQHLPNEYWEKSEDKYALYSSGITFPELAWLKDPYCLTSGLQEQERQYRRQYPINSLYERCTNLRWLENLTVLDYLNLFQNVCDFLPKDANSPIHWLDVGSKNWAYVDALWAFIIAHHQSDNPKSLEGIEIDPYRRYTDGFHRLDYAEHYVNRLPDPHAIKTEYHVGDVQQWQGVCKTTEKYQVISWFLPFVFEEPLISWGLPSRHFEPEKTLSHVLGLLDNDGYLLLVNQTIDEYEEQQNLLNTLKTVERKNGINLDIHALGELPASFLPFRYSRYGTICHKAP